MDTKATRKFEQDLDFSESKSEDQLSDDSFDDP